MSQQLRNVFLLQKAQPLLLGAMDGSLSTLAPLFAVLLATHTPFTAFLVSLSAAIGGGISMTISEALSDDGLLSGRGSPYVRGGITGAATFMGGALHSLPCLIPQYHAALIAELIVVGLELILIGYLRHRFLGIGYWQSMSQVIVGGVLIVAAGLLLGSA